MYRKEVLENGLRIVTEEIPHVRSVCVGIWVGSGVKDENKKNNGISHFIEHMMFKGTKRRSAKEIAETLEAVGGQLNAATDKEYTCYYTKVLSSHTSLALDLLLDMLTQSTFDPREIEREKKIVIEEIKMYEDSPDELIHDLFVQTIWGGHRLGQNILGKKEAINSLTREDILLSLKQSYTPDNLIVAAAGHLKSEEVIRQVKEVFARIWGKKEKVYETKARLTPQVFIKEKDTEQVHLCLGTKGVHQTHKDKYALAVLGTILGGGMSSRLFQEIRERRALAYSIYSYEHCYRKNGLFGIYAGASPANLNTVVRLIVKELNRLKEKMVRKLELNKAKEQLKGALMLSLESTGTRASKLARSEFYLGREITLDEIITQINKVSADDLKRVANDLLKKEDLTLAALGPLKQDEKKRLLEIVRE